MKINKLFQVLKSKLGKIFGKNKKFVYLAIILVVLVCLCVFVFPKNDKSAIEEINKTETIISNSSKYEVEIEQKIKQMLLAVSEIKTANVMVVCDSTESVEYLKNRTETTTGSGDSSSKTTTEEVVYEKNGSNSSAIVVSKTMPKIIGVWIVINSISPSTKLAITNSISSVLNINESSISILQE